MSETDHLHERGSADGWTTVTNATRCKYCNKRADPEWWDAYEQAIADVLAHGPPDHAKRLARVLAVYGNLPSGIREAIIQAYWAPLEPAP